LSAPTNSGEEPKIAVTLPFWENVQQKFFEWAGQPGTNQLAALSTEPPNTEHLVKQCVGLLLTILVHARRPANNHDDLIQESPYLLAEEIEKRNIRQEYRRKAIELGVVLP
jgi:hypothetical protein